MTRWLALVCVLASACGGGETHTPVTPTPIGLSLPPGAPGDAAAKPGTTRITITAVEIIGPDGARVTPDRLKVTPTNCQLQHARMDLLPAGFEGPQGGSQNGISSTRFERAIRRRTPAVPSALRLEEGYTVIEAPLAMTTRPGRQRVTTEILRNYAVIAAMNLRPSSVSERS
jgi:hypothetical protein